ncbi:MAG: stage II sporulation protein D [Anaerovoracaceae bacterium]|jgi:stage II sporulation protein D
MKRYYKNILKYAICICLLVCFSLIIMPMVLVGLYPNAIVPDKDPSPSEGEPRLITVYRHNTSKTETIDFEEYVKGVVAGEMPSNFEMEALKAQAVAARTYSLSKIIRSGDGGNPDHPSAPICDDTHCQVYRSPAELKEIKSEEWMNTGWPRIEEAVNSTRGQLMYYEGSLVEQPLFHSSSGGRTENSEDVFVSALPYLRAVDSPYEKDAPHQNQQLTIPLDEFTKKLKRAYPNENIGTIKSSTVKILSRSDGGRVVDVKIGNLTLKGRKIREIFGLRSANFTLSIQGNTVVFTSDGYGHGVGMSQWGANGMAQAGYNYKEILSHYYTGVEIY